MLEPTTSSYISPLFRSFSWVLFYIYTPAAIESYRVRTGEYRKGYTYLSSRNQKFSAGLDFVNIYQSSVFPTNQMDSKSLS